jgi:hypothetical protein
MCVCACVGTNIPATVHTQEFEHTARRILNMACDTNCLVCQFLAKQGVRENALTAYIHTYIHAYMCVCVCLCVCVCVCVCVCCMHVHTHARTHTHICAYKYI